MRVWQVTTTEAVMMLLMSTLAGLCYGVASADLKTAAMGYVFSVLCAGMVVLYAIVIVRQHRRV